MKHYIVLLLVTLILLIGLVPASVFAAILPAVQNEGFIEPVGTVGLLTDLTPQYGSNGKLIAPIEPPATGSIAISSGADLMKIGIDSNYPLSGTYPLTAEIDLNPALYGGTEWVPIGSGSGVNDFTGTSDGQGYAIRTLTITGVRHYAGLFGYSDGGAIKNIGMEETSTDVSSPPSASYSYYYTGAGIYSRRA